MNRIEKIGVSRIGPFKKGVVLPIVPGVTFLYGKNELSNGNANAVGKSLLGKSIQELFYEPEVRGDKQKTGRRFVTFYQGKKQIKVVSNLSGKEDVELFVNGEDVSARTNAQTKKQAAALWGVSQEEFATYGLVDSQVPHPLVKGGTTARKAFFNSFFGLDRMDEEKKIFAKKLSEIRKVKAAHAELEAAFSSVRRDMLPKAEREALEVGVANAQAQLDKLISKQERASASQQIAAFASVAAPKLKALQKRTVRDVGTISKELKEAAKVQEQLDEYKDYLRARKRYEIAAEGLDLSKDMEMLRRNARLYDSSVARLEEIGELDEPKFTEAAPKKPKIPRVELEASQRRLKHALEHSRKFAKGVCDTCGQDVKAKDPKIVKRELAEVDAALETWDEVDEYKALAKEHETKHARYLELQAEVRKLRKELPGLKTDAALYRKRSELVKPKKVEKPEAVYDVRELELELELARFAEDNEDMIEALKTYKPVDFDPKQLNVVQEKLYAMKAKLELHNSVKKRAAEMRDRLGELQEAMAKQQMLEIILEGYADRAVKKMAIESISTHLMASVNRYAALVFENYSFEFVWGTQIQILVHRPEGTSDVRRLSGAESMLFTLILILALLVFVPKRKRLSLLILDEPYASFSEGTSELFTKLLPHITQVIPSVLVITPKSEFRIAGATELTVVKTSDGSVIMKGHPSEI